MNAFFKKIALPIMVVGLVACGGSDDDNDPGNIAEVATGAGNFNTLVAALGATGLDTVLSDEEGTFTVFAPTDEAFAKLGGDAIQGLLDDPDTLRDILLYHVIVGSEVGSAAAISAAADNLEDNKVETSGDVTLSLNGGNLFVNFSKVIEADVAANNGVIHAIDTVLIPTTAGDNTTTNIVEVAQADDNFSTLVELVVAAELAGTLSDANANYTVFAPTNAAFAKLDPDLVTSLLLPENKALLQQLLTYHVFGQEVDAVGALDAAGSALEMVSGDKLAVSFSDGALYANTSKVSIANVDASNGIVHAIDTVLVPVGFNAAAPTLNIVETAIDADNFTTLAAALGAAGVVDTLSDPESSFTVFAPTDEAFAALGQETIDALLADTETLSKILLKHVVSGSVDSVSALTFNGKNVATANPDGETLALDIIDGEVFVNDSQITTFDIQTTNGIIHVIDSVILLDE